MFEIVIFDWKRTLYDPDQEILIVGAKNLLEFIKSNNIPMVLIGKGGDKMDEEVSRLGIKGYFKQIIFAEGTKDPHMFMPYISEDDSKKTLFIGEGPLNEDQKPEYTVSNLTDCKLLLQNLF